MVTWSMAYTVFDCLNNTGIVDSNPRHGCVSTFFCIVLSCPV